MKSIYTVWLGDDSVSVDDPDHEWPACFVVDGRTAASAKEWGDEVAEKYAAVHGQHVIRSAVEPFDSSALPGLGTLPVVIEGDTPTDDDIGW